MKAAPSSPRRLLKGAPAPLPFILALALMAAVSAAVYFFPRLLVSRLGGDSPWLSYFYTYGMGGIVFGLSAIWIFSRKRAALRRKEERLWLLAVLCGLSFSCLAHGLWIFLAVSFPVKP